MTGIPLGRARHGRIGNDLFRSLPKHDDRMPGHFIDLTWSGCNDWWTKGTETKGRGVRRFRIDYANCDVHEPVDE